MATAPGRVTMALLMRGRGSTARNDTLLMFHLLMTMTSEPREHRVGGVNIIKFAPFYSHYIQLHWQPCQSSFNSDEERLFTRIAVPRWVATCGRHNHHHHHQPTGKSFRFYCCAVKLIKRLIVDAVTAVPINDDPGTHTLAIRRRMHT